MTEISIEPFRQAHLDGLIALVAAEGRTEYADDVERTRRALTALGVTTLVAIAGGHLVGAIQVQSERRQFGPLAASLEMCVRSARRGLRKCACAIGRSASPYGQPWRNVLPGTRTAGKYFHARA